MEEVASEAGYSVGALYKYFAGKDELYLSLKETIDQELAAVQERPVPSSLDFWQSFELVLLRYFEVLERNRDWIVVLLAERSELERRMRFNVGESDHGVLGEAIEFMTGRLEQGIADGAVRQVSDPVVVAYMAIGAVHARVEHWMLTGSPEDSLIAAAGDVLRFLKQGLGAGATEPSPPSSAPTKPKSPVKSDTDESNPQ